MQLQRYKIKISIFPLLLFLLLKSSNGYSQTESLEYASGIIPGAYHLKEYIPLLQGKRVAVVANQTSVIGETHLVDTLLALKMNVRKVFAPEHGFRGQAGAAVT